MESNTNYILDKKELQSLLKRTVEIKKYKSGYVQFVTKGVKDPIYYSFNIADILNIKVDKTYRAITKLKNAITDDNDNVISFREKSETDSELINIGYMVCSPKILSYITSDSMSLEMDVIEKLCQENKVYSYLHTGFWQCMDTLREKNQLEDLWNSGKALWKIW